MLAGRASPAGEQPAELAVDNGDLPVVGARREPLREVGRRIVRGVGVEVVHPRQPGRGGGADPVHGAAGGRRRPALHVGHAARVSPPRQLVVVGLEPAGKAVAPVQREAGHEGRRAVARVAEDLGQGRRGRGSTKDPLSRTPWARGRSPVRIEACEGAVSGVWAIAVAKRTPRAARASRTGVTAAESP